MHGQRSRTNMYLSLCARCLLCTSNGNYIVYLSYIVNCKYTHILHMFLGVLARSYIFYRTLWFGTFISLLRALLERDRTTQKNVLQRTKHWACSSGRVCCVCAEQNACMLNRSLSQMRACQCALHAFERCSFSWHGGFVRTKCVINIPTAWRMRMLVGGGA